MTHVQVAIIGAGFSGIAALARLVENGETSLTVLEKADDVGGTWRDNRYPGCACDVPSHLYSLSFAPNPEWTRSFSGQREIHAYLRKVVDDRNLRRFVRTGTEVKHLRWTGDRWLVSTSTGDLTATAVISGAGFLSTPALPDVPGLADFRGTVVHTATWDDDLDLRGKRVAVVGTGASAIQTIPEVQKVAASVHVFQRTPAWVLPRRDRRITDAEKSLFRRVPAAQKLARGLIYTMRESVWMPAFAYRPQLQNTTKAVAKAFLRTQVKDPALRKALTPDYQIGCKRVLLSNDYYKALVAPNAELIPQAVTGFTPTGVVAADGTTREVDVVVLATGFHVTDSPIPSWFTGRDGRTLADVWADKGMGAFRGTSFAGFPNLFFMLGPNTALGHTSVVYMAEAQLPYILGALRVLKDSGAVGIEPKQDRQDAWNATIQQKMKRTVWATGGCSSWYMDAQGRNPTLWPEGTLNFRYDLRQFDIGEHRLLTPAESAPAPAGVTESAFSAS